MEPARRALIAKGFAHLDELQNQTRVGEATVGPNPSLLLVLRKRSELCQKLLWRTLTHSPFGEEFIEFLLRRREGSAVVVMSCRCRGVIFFSIERIAQEVLQTLLIPANST